MLEIDPDYIGPDTDPNGRDHRSPSPAQPSFAESLLSLASDNVGRVVVHFTGAGLVYNTGATFINHFDADPYSAYQQINIFYPFSDLDEWKMANYLLTSKLSMSALDKFLSLEVTKKMSLSFLTAKVLHAQAGLLPSGPQWNFRIVPTTHPTKQPVHLYFCDALNCMESLFNHPFFAEKMDYMPFCLFTIAECVVRVFTKWMSSNCAWDKQSQIPEGTTLCGVILSLDKTNITNMCGGRVAHPLLISLVNIKMAV
ncbi:hypothetical protein J3A83DRAFT_4101029 [Scleroderma citrinum]